MIRVERLVAHPQALQVLAAGYLAEWPDWYGPAGAGRAEEDLRARMQADRLPLGLVALDADRPVGAVALTPSSIASHVHLRPWVSGLWTAPDRRGRGLGARLVRAAEDEARRLGIPRLHAATAAAASLFLREGWTVAETVDRPSGLLTIVVKTTV